MATYCLEKQLSCYPKHTVVKRKNTWLMLNGLTFSSLLIVLSLTSVRGVNTLVVEDTNTLHLLYFALFSGVDTCLLDCP